MCGYRSKVRHHNTVFISALYRLYEQVDNEILYESNKGSRLTIRGTRRSFTEAFVSERWISCNWYCHRTFCFIKAAWPKICKKTFLFYCIFYFPMEELFQQYKDHSLQSTTYVLSPFSPSPSMCMSQNIFMV